MNRFIEKVQTILTQWTLKFILKIVYKVQKKTKAYKTYKQYANQSYNKI